MLFTEVSVTILPEDARVEAVTLADKDVKCGEFGEVHGLKHSSAFIADLFSKSVDASDPSMLLVPGSNVSPGEVGLWNEC